MASSSRTGGKRPDSPTLDSSSPVIRQPPDHPCLVEYVAQNPHLENESRSFYGVITINRQSPSYEGVLIDIRDILVDQTSAFDVQNRVSGYIHSAEFELYLVTVAVGNSGPRAAFIRIKSQQDLERAWELGKLHSMHRFAARIVEPDVADEPLRKTGRRERVKHFFSRFGRNMKGT